MKEIIQKRLRKERRHHRVRSVVKGSGARPRLSVFRSHTHIYAQLIDDAAGKTLAAASSLNTPKKGKKTDMAKVVGQSIAKKALALGLKKVAFDRGGFAYHGRVKAVAEAAREHGLEF